MSTVNPDVPPPHPPHPVPPHPHRPVNPRDISTPPGTGTPPPNQQQWQAWEAAFSVWCEAVLAWAAQASQGLGGPLMPAMPVPPPG